MSCMGGLLLPAGAGNLVRARPIRWPCEPVQALNRRFVAFLDTYDPSPRDAGRDGIGPPAHFAYRRVDRVDPSQYRSMMKMQSIVNVPSSLARAAPDIRTCPSTLAKRFVPPTTLLVPGAGK